MTCHGSLKPRWCLAQAVQLWRLVTVNMLWESALLTLDVWCQEGSGPEQYCCWRRCWSHSLCIQSHHTRPLRAGMVSHAPLFLKQMRSDISNHAEHSQDVDKVSMCVLTMNMHHSKDRIKHRCENWQFILLLFYDWIAETT